MRSNCNNAENPDKPEWCDDKDCPYWLPWYPGDACKDCKVAPLCQRCDPADNGAQMTIDFDSI